MIIRAAGIKIIRGSISFNLLPGVPVPVPEPPIEPFVNSARTFTQDRFASVGSAFTILDVANDSLDNQFMLGNYVIPGEAGIFVRGYDDRWQEQWTKLITSTSAQAKNGTLVQRSVVHDSGIVFTAGNVTVSALESWAVITAISEDGMPLFAKRNGFSSALRSILLTDIATLSGGDLIVVGSIMRSSTSVPSTAGLVMRITPQGVVVWSRGYGTTISSIIRKVAVDQSTDEIYTVVGINTADALTCKYNSSGGLVWQKDFGILPGSSSASVAKAVFYSGHLYLAIVVNHNFNNSGGANLLKISSAGFVQWAKIINTGNNRVAGYTDLSVDPANGILVGTGNIQTANNLVSPFVSYYDTSGILLIIRTFNQSNILSNPAKTVTVNDFEKAYITATTNIPVITSLMVVNVSSLPLNELLGVLSVSAPSFTQVFNNSYTPSSANFSQTVTALSVSFVTANGINFI